MMTVYIAAPNERGLIIYTLLAPNQNRLMKIPGGVLVHIQAKSCYGVSYIIIIECGIDAPSETVQHKKLIGLKHSNVCPEYLPASS